MRVKDLYIQIREYDFSGNKKGQIFIGREEVTEKLQRRLRPSSKNETEYKGAYLVAGYRGMGKSTMVDRVILAINRKEEEESEIRESDSNESEITERLEVLPIRVFLSQGNLSDYDLLRQMFVQLEANLNEKYKLHSLAGNSILKAGLISLVAILLISFIFHVLIIYGVMPNPIVSFLHEIATNEVLTLIIYLALYLFSFMGIKHKFSKQKVEYRILAKRLFEVKQRVHSDLEMSNGDSDSELSVSHAASDITLPFSFIMGKRNNSSSKQLFQKFTTKELEFELKEILELLSTFFWDKLKIIFIVDELDKLEPEYSDGKINPFLRDKSRVDSRRDIINSLLANLKSFINTADAKFVFIGGAEMYEASLADIADRESFYSSIFDEVFYINTFFKDGVIGVKKNITQMVDSYLINKIIFDENDISVNNPRYPNYSHFYSRISCVGDEKIRSLILYLLNRYLIYLTYRSNGSPKKLKMLIEDSILEVGHSRKVRPDSIVLNFKNEKKSEYDISKSPRLTYEPGNQNRNIVPGTYLQIKFNLQYKSALHTSIFLPFLIKNEHHLIEFNDKNLYLSAFLMDHILKFHKSAFSWRELELIPDIIIGSKGPSLRDTMDEIINYLSVKHIRETTNAMFQYKFRSRIALELKYISKISNESAAAFNFTFDESEHLKTFFKRKLKQKIEDYKDNKSIVGDSFIHSLTYLNSLIAEIHFYDEDYGSAIRYYSDAIQALRSSDYIENNHQKKLFTRYRLLLSLCLEKSKNYDSTYSILRSTLIDIRDINFNSKSNVRTRWEQPFKRMQLFLRPHLSLLVAIEKKRSDGITFSNLKRNIKEYTDFMGLVDLFPYIEFNSDLDFRDMVKYGKEGDYKRIQTLLADYFQSVGAILFYKNRNFLKLYEKGATGILFKHLGIHNFNAVGGQDFTSVPYLCVDKVRNSFGVKHGNYYPSFSSFFYYSTSLGHLLLPFIENMQAIYGEDFPQKHAVDMKLSDKLFMLEHLAFDNRALHILGGKQKELIALILSKLSDSILSCIGSDENVGFKLRNNSPNFDLFLNKDYKNKGTWAYCKIDSFEDLFDINTALYFNILSSKFYHSADKHYDSFFTLKKCLYILVNHRSLWVPESTDFLDKLIIWLFNHCKEILSTNSISPRLSEEYFFSNVTNTDFTAGSLLFSDDEIELEILEDRYALLKLKKDEDKVEDLLDKYNNSSSTISSIFSRAQKLKFQTELIYARHASLIDQLLQLKAITSISCSNESITFFDHTNEENTANHLSVIFPSTKFFKYGHDMMFCYKNLITIINTYGIGYTMSNSYIASIYKNLTKWSQVLENLNRCLTRHIKNPNLKIISADSTDFVGNLEYLLAKTSHLFNTKKNRNKAIEHYEKAVSLHSEGAEYKRINKDMYILEDDFNDGLIHFYAALERSILNAGIISKRLNKLKEESELAR